MAGVAGGAILLSVGARSLDAQQGSGARVVPTNQTVITGYGTVGYFAQPQGENVNAFTAKIAPVFLFQFQDRFLFEAELEFELSEGVTETGLEYASLDYIANDNLVLVGGKFLLPFGVFGPRIHPTWINKFPTSPPIYGHGVTNFGVAPLLPVLADVGAMGRATFTPGRYRVAFNLYAVNGPRIDTGGDHGDEDGDEDPPGLDFPASSDDNNPDKAWGGRVDLGLPPWVEVNLSYLNGDYDDGGILDFTAWNLAGELHLPSFQLRGEYIQTRQEIEIQTGFPIVKRDGYYAQAAYRWKRWEPVARWTQAFDTRQDGQVLQEGAWQAGFALDYWFAPAIAFMVGYEFNREDGTEIDNDRVVMHVAFGF